VYRGSEGAGIGVRYKFNETFNLSATYLTSSSIASNPNEGKGLFNGSFSTGVQLGISPLDNLDMAFTYLHSYNTDDNVNVSGRTGSEIGRKPFGNTATNSDRFGFQLSWKFLENVNFAGWFGYGTATAEEDGIDLRGDFVDAGDDTDLWSWNASLSFLDLGKEGAILSVSGGMPFKSGKDLDTSYLIQTQYLYPLSKNIFITPGVYVILNPNHDEDNDPIWVGVLRTTFKF
jgi:hypothetical protein